MRWAFPEDEDGLSEFRFDILWAMWQIAAVLSQDAAEAVTDELGMSEKAKLRHVYCP